MTRTKTLLDETMDKHRHIKEMMLVLLEKANTVNYSKEKIKDDLFKVYMEFK